MGGPWKRPVTSAALTAALTTVLAVAAAGCSDSGDGGSSPSDLVSQAASAVESIGSQATGAIASATEEAGRKLEEIKGGVDAKSDVTLGTARTDGNGYSTVAVTARNTTDAAKSFTVQVTYKDVNGNLLDTVVLTVSDVPASGSKEATARSNRKLSGEVKTEVTNAVRY
jgi:hypothetical protein